MFRHFADRECQLGLGAIANTRDRAPASDPALAGRPADRADPGLREERARAGAPRTERRPRRSVAGPLEGLGQEGRDRRRGRVVLVARGGPHVAESRTLEEGAEAPHPGIAALPRALEGLVLLERRLGAAVRRREQEADSVRRRDADHAARRQDPAHLGDRVLRAGQVLEQRVRVDCVERAVREGQGGGVARGEGPPGIPRPAARAASLGSTSTPTVGPGATAAARPSVIVPGPQPQSRSRIPGRRCGRRKPAWLSAVRWAIRPTAMALWPGRYPCSGRVERDEPDAVEAVERRDLLGAPRRDR
jgi:hypothetical protein